MGRACACCLPTKSSSSSSSRDDSFHICVLGQVVDVGPLRSETEVVVQAAWVHNNAELRCADDDSTQQITLTLSYNYDTEVMSYSYVFNCLKADGTTANPAGGGGSGSGTFSIKPPLHTTIECHTEKLDLGGSLGAVWPWITCNDVIVNEDCVPVGGCNIIMRHLCLKQVKDELFCDKAGGPETPWGDSEWYDKFNFLNNPGGSLFEGLQGKYARLEWSLGHGGIDYWEWGCGGCYREERCCAGGSTYCNYDDFFNWFTPIDWGNDKFLDIVLVDYSYHSTSGLMLPHRINYGTDVKMGYDPDPCYEDLKERGPCRWLNGPTDDPVKNALIYCQEKCEEDPGFACDCKGQVSPWARMRETCDCAYYYENGEIYYYGGPPCDGKGPGHTYGCGLIDIGELFYTKYPGYDTFRIKVAVKVGYPGRSAFGPTFGPGPGPICYNDCRYKFLSSATSSCPTGFPNSETACITSGWSACIEIFDSSNGFQIRSANVNDCGGIDNDPNFWRGGRGGHWWFEQRCRVWHGQNQYNGHYITSGPFATYIYPPLYGRYMNYVDESLKSAGLLTPYNVDNPSGGVRVTPFSKLFAGGGFKAGTPFGGWSWEETIEQSLNYTFYAYADNVLETTGENLGKVKNMSWDDFKSSSCVTALNDLMLSHAEEPDYSPNVIKSKPTIDPVPGITYHVNSWQWPCRMASYAIRPFWYYDESWHATSFYVSWASSSSSDAICEGGAPGGGDPGGPLEIETWDDSPQNFSWTRFVPHTETDNVTGGTPPYQASVATGTLPDGLSVSISSSGLLSISGTTDDDAGAYLCTIQVVDQGGNIALTDQITITVQDTEDPSGTIKFEKWYRSQTLANGLLNQFYTAVDQVTGGAAPYNKVEVITGSLPPGLSVFINDSGRVVIMGIPVEVGRFQFKLRATDSRDETGDSATLALEIWGFPSGGPGGGPGDPDPTDPEGLIAPGETINYTGPTIIYPPQGSTARSGLRFHVAQSLDNPNSLPSGLHLNEITGAITGIFPSGSPPRVVPIFCRVSGTAVFDTGNPSFFTYPSGPATALSGLGLNEAGGSLKRLDAMIPIQFNMRSKILPPSGNIVGAQGDSTTVWNASDIQEGDILFSIIADADGTPTVDLSSGWNMVIPTQNLMSTFPSSGLFRGSGTGRYRNMYKTQLNSVGNVGPLPFPSGLPSGVLGPAITGVSTPTGLFPSSYSAVALYKVAGTGDAAYGTKHSQTVGAGLISSIGFRKPSGLGTYNIAPRILNYVQDESGFEVDLDRIVINSGIEFTSGTKTNGSGIFFIPEVPISLGRNNYTHVKGIEIAVPDSTGVAVNAPIENPSTLPVPSGATALYIWTANSTTAFQTNGPSGVISEEFTLNKEGTSAGTFPGFTNPLSMMIAVSQYSLVRPSSVSPVAGSPTGCNVLVLEF